MSTFSKVQSCVRTRQSYVSSANNVFKRLIVTSSHNHNHLNFPSTRLCYHWDTLPPVEAQLTHAHKFFTKIRPERLWSTSEFHSMSFGDSPEVCFLGRSNVSRVLLAISILLVSAGFMRLLGVPIVWGLYDQQK